MFGRKKQIAQEEKLSQEIDNILNNQDIKSEERQVLENAKERINDKKYFTRTLAELEGGLRPLAIKSELTPDVAKLYSSIINETYKDSGWSGVRFF